MRVEYNEDSIHIIPDTDIEKVYLETILDMHEKGDTAIAERIAPMGLDMSFAYVKISKTK